MIPRLVACALLSLSGLAALGGGSGWLQALPDWLPGPPHWGQEWELADLEQSVDLHPPVEVERWLYNPRERTALGLERLGAPADGPDDAGNEDADERADRALAAFEAAARLAPDDRRVLFNTGTARLLADHGDAVEALERAVAEGDAPALPPAELQRAWYNLGAARMAASDAAGAVDAFEEALRRDPADADAKYNLEVALRRLDEERRRLMPPRETPDGNRPGDEDESSQSGGTDPDDREGDDSRGARDPEDGDQEAESRPDDGASYGRRPVEGFEEQADLTAEQASALLAAVETLERKERQTGATRAAAQAADEEDW